MAFRWFDRLRKAEIERAENADVRLIPDPAETHDNLVIWIKSLGPKLLRPEQQEAAIGRLFSELSVGDLRGLDYDMRWRESWRSQPWESMKPSEAAFTIQRAADQVVVAAGFSMHRNGYIREIAVNVLAGTGDKRAIPWLTLRSGDWVEQVRGAALDGLGQFLIPETAAELVEVLPLLKGGRLSGGERRRICLPRSSESWSCRSRPRLFGQASVQPRSSVDERRSAFYFGRVRASSFCILCDVDQRGAATTSAALVVATEVAFGDHGACSTRTESITS